ncbi:hypothetical protein FGO68_gene9350 [Halteria grandinella]|uniref:Uncharacterized protein n=1 Tax=Halteria grandinella TaxID=5974 RepID=A0A8J8N991_HALGN|nr:hypothetical protein FGO68_gene9350 [Halteria grandinella]
MIYDLGEKTEVNSEVRCESQPILAKLEFRRNPVGRREFDPRVGMEFRELQQLRQVILDVSANFQVIRASFGWFRHRV